MIDLDAALGTGDNTRAHRAAAAARPLPRRRRHPRLPTAARRWLDAGAARVIIGTAATPELLRELPRERVIAALDARDGEVVVEGWTQAHGRARGRTHAGAARALRRLPGHLRRAGRADGGSRPADARRDLAEPRPDGARVTVAGGVRTAGRGGRRSTPLGSDAQVGMALYTGASIWPRPSRPRLARDRADGPLAHGGLRRDGRALGLVWSNRESVRRGLASGPRRLPLPPPRPLDQGAESGDTQDLLRVDLDCDRDALRFTVRQNGDGFCHLGTRTCWGEDRGLARLARRLAARRTTRPRAPTPAACSTTRRCCAPSSAKRPASWPRHRRRTTSRPRAADLLYFTLVALARAGGRWDDVAASWTAARAR